MGLCCPVELEPPKAVSELPGVGKGEWFGDFDDKTAFDVLDFFREVFGGFEDVGAGDAAKDGDACAGRVADDLHDGDAYSDCHAEFKRPDYCGEEYEEHGDEVLVRADREEKLNVCWGFFQEGEGNHGDHCRKDTTLRG